MMPWMLLEVGDAYFARIFGIGGSVKRYQFVPCSPETRVPLGMLLVPRSYLGGDVTFVSRRAGR